MPTLLTASILLLLQLLPPPPLLLLPLLLSDCGMYRTCFASHKEDIAAAPAASQ
jgi:hypothetical protein